MNTLLAIAVFYIGIGIAGWTRRLIDGRVSLDDRHDIALATWHILSWPLDVAAAIERFIRARRS